MLDQIIRVADPFDEIFRQPPRPKISKQRKNRLESITLIRERREERQQTIGSVRNYGAFFTEGEKAWRGQAFLSRFRVKRVRRRFAATLGAIELSDGIGAELDHTMLEPILIVFA